MQKRSQLSIHRRQAIQTLRLCQQQHAVIWNVTINLTQKKLFNQSRGIILNLLMNAGSME